MAIFGKYKGTISPLMTWYADYSYSRTSNSVVQVAVTVTGEINNHASTSWMGTGNNIVVTVTVAGASKTHEIKTSSSAWYGNTNNPRSCYFVFDVPSAAAGQNIGVSYSVAGSGYTAAAAVPTQSTSFESPALLYTASQPSVGNAVMGSAVTIYTNRQYDTMTHTVKWSFGNSSGTVGTGVGWSVNWTPEIDLAAQIPNAPSGTGTITCDTYVGSTYIGTKTTPITISIPSGSSAITPTCDLTIDLVRTLEPEDWDVYVKGYSRYRARVNAAGKYGASISSCSVSGGGYSGASTDFTSSGVLWSVGDNVITARVTDSRGQTAESAKTITVYDYDKPSIKSTNVFRCNADGTANERGASVSVTANFSFSSVGGKNSLTAVVQWKKTSESYFGNSTAIQSGKTVVVGGESIDPNYSYTFRVLLTDAINSSYSDAPISSIVYPFYIKDGGKAVGFGKTAEEDELVDSAWDVKAPNFQGRAYSVLGQYDTWTNSTGYGGKQPPSYVGANNVRCNMMDGFQGTSSSSLPLMDVLLMNAYGWSDVPYATAFGVQKTHGVPRAWIAAGKNGDSWGGVTELITTNNIGSQTVNNANNFGGHSPNYFASNGNPNNLLHSGNEFTYASDGFSGGIWHNYRTAGWNTNGNITAYYFGDGACNYSGVTLCAGYFTGRSEDSVRVYRQQVRTGAYYVPNYTCNTAAGTNYYGDVSVSINFSDPTYGYLPSRPNTVILQVLDGTTGVIQIEPVSWDYTGIWTIRIHRANAVTNVSGFYITWFAMA